MPKGYSNKTGLPLKPPSRKGLKHTQESKIKLIKNHSGKHYNTKTEFKKGIIPWNRGIKMGDEFRKKVSESHKGIQTNENNPQWKGKKVGYVALHNWVKRYLGTPTICEFCGKTGLTGRQIHWANKDHRYHRNLKDWLRLCSYCHYKYDKNIKFAEAGTMGITIPPAEAR